MEMKIDAEFKNLIPPLSKEEYEQLEKNILAEGIRENIIVWNDIIIDGHNRYEIAQKNGIEYKTIEKEFASRENAIEWIILNQLGRRNISNYTRSLLALKFKSMFEGKAKGKQIEAGGAVPQKSAKPSIDTRQELAKLAGVSHDTIAKVQKIEATASKELKGKIENGDLSINQAYQKIRQEEKVKNVEKKVNEAKNNSASFVDIHNTNKKYNIIYADPAWKYTDWDNGLRNPKNHYQTMTIEDICNLPVKDIAADSCILFLWTTYPLLQESFKVLEAWGFTYKTAGFIWVKKNKSNEGNFFGCGNWTRANSEICLIALKGNVTRLNADISQIIESPIEEHSKKPDEVRNLITRLVGELPRIELFSRKAVNGWDCWGNEL